MKLRIETISRRNRFYRSFSIVTSVVFTEIKFRIDSRSTRAVFFSSSTRQKRFGAAVLFRIFGKERTPLADTVRRTSWSRWMIDLHRIILHGYSYGWTPRQEILSTLTLEKRRREGTKRTLKRDTVSPQPVFQAFLPSTCLVSSRRLSPWIRFVTVHIKKEKRKRISVHVYLCYPVLTFVSFFAIFFQLCTFYFFVVHLCRHRNLSISKSH